MYPGATAEVLVGSSVETDLAGKPSNSKVWISSALVKLPGALEHLHMPRDRLQPESAYGSTTAACGAGPRCLRSVT